MELERREDWGLFLASLGLVGEAVEIGTHQADLAVEILSKWPGKLTCIDPWADLPEYIDDPVAARDRSLDYATAKRRLAPFGDRCQIVRDKSYRAVGQFRDASIAFVYVDGNHRRPYVDLDLERFWPKIQPGGILAGHDYINASHPGVKGAVDDFANRHGVELHYIPRPWGEWWIFKPPGIRGLQETFAWPSESPEMPENLHGWLAIGTHRMLTERCPMNAMVVVECGTWAGLSASVLLRHAPVCTLICIDHWCEDASKLDQSVIVPEAKPLVPTIWRQFVSNHWKNRERIVPVRSDTLDGLRLVHEFGIVPDFVYLDSDHSKTRLLAELRLCEEFWPGVALGGDDYTQLSVRAAVEEFCRESSRKLEHNDTAFWTEET